MKIVCSGLPCANTEELFGTQIGRSYRETIVNIDFFAEHFERTIPHECEANESVESTCEQRDDRELANSIVQRSVFNVNYFDINKK